MKTKKKAQVGTTVLNDSIRRNTINRVTGMKQGDMDDYAMRHSQAHAKADSTFNANYSKDSMGEWKRKTPYVPPKKNGGKIKK